MAQSPGMMSLNSVGTISPARPPCFVIDPASVEMEKTVIELRIRPKDIRQIKVVTSAAMTKMMEMKISQNKMKAYTAMN